MAFCSENACTTIGGNNIIAISLGYQTCKSKRERVGTNLVLVYNMSMYRTVRTKLYLTFLVANPFIRCQTYKPKRLERVVTTVVS
jgi:hypothetical protein